MYLKKIIASGFKSFADKTSIDFSPGITGIVGPNGSGKSNVVDAVRWVLGEQSIKSLRGSDKMTDVIFSGSKSRNSVNVASVTLEFDNRDHYLKLDFDEVSIRRRVYKDGTNEYSINEEKCRLKDITDLFLDSGASRESFNIISQGKVEEIISSKPEDRRTVFEEAAGVAKYRKRKEEALKKLEKTHENLARVEDIEKELKEQVEPLRLQREKALIYKEKSESLKKIEVAVIATDIQEMNFKYQASKARIEELNDEILSLSTSSSTGEVKIETLKGEISALEAKINEETKRFVEQTSLVEKASSKKTILLERQKYEVSDLQIHQNMVALKEDEMRIRLEMSSLEAEKERLEKEIHSLEDEEKSKEEEKRDLLTTRTNLSEQLSSMMKENYAYKNKIASLQHSIENNSLLTSGVKAVLNHPKLSGIHDVIGHLIEMEEKFVTAITTSLGASASFVVVEDTKTAEAAIQYLKENRLGRVTFFPIDTIKSRVIDEREFTSLEGFVGIASALVKFDKKYTGIIENQLGNVIVADTLENATKMSKKLNHRYKIVTLEGELLHIGGSLTGGSIANNRNVISEKYELEDALRTLSYSDKKIADIEDKINEVDYSLKAVEDKIYLVSKKKIEISSLYAVSAKSLTEKEENYHAIQNELETAEGMLNGSLTKEEEQVMQAYYDALEQKNKTEAALEELKAILKDKKDTLETNEFESRKESNLVSSKTKELNALEIEVNRMDVKLDTLLSKLNETYTMTYEAAIQNYPLELEIDEARETVKRLKEEIKELGVINMLAIEEYERVNERYSYLVKQKEDLLEAENTLLEIIKEMDEVMIHEFEESFKLIRENFKKTFQELFRGGNADLTLTNPENMLETGIEIIASPPGKTLKSISFLSGGEKTFTAISLLFAILKSRPVPYCILDEVEAALDEVNVDSFGEYLKTLKDKTQFILITHKKKTMEYADYLYGITMQESGVSKLVSVKLEEVES